MRGVLGPDQRIGGDCEQRLPILRPQGAQADKLALQHRLAAEHGRYCATAASAAMNLGRLAWVSPAMLMRPEAAM